MSGEESGRSNSNRNNNRSSRTSRGGGRSGRGRVDRLGHDCGGHRANNINDYAHTPFGRGRGRGQQQQYRRQQQHGATRRNRGGRWNGIMDERPQGHGRMSNIIHNPLIDGDSLAASVVTNAVSAKTSSQSLQTNPFIDADSLTAASVLTVSTAISTSRTSSTITIDSDIAPRNQVSLQHPHNYLSNQNINTKNNDIITILPWPHPSSHYLPIAEEERLLPTLIRWGKNERGMMKHQPEFRLRQLQQQLLLQQQQQQQQQQQYRIISLLQSLSLRRHHLKLLNPNLRMSDLRLGSEDHILEAATLFEVSVSSYLRRHGVEFWTEKDQQRIHVRKNRYEKQPPTPDFRMRDGHVVVLDLVCNEEQDGSNVHNHSSSSSSSSNNNMPASSTSNDNTDNSNNNSQPPIITTIHWIEAKMFYGASTIPHGTPNAVGTILSKVKQYVALYGHGAIVFMYGCGDQLASQLLNVGVLALDGRCLDLDDVVRHQRMWCSDAHGNILF